MNKASRVVYTAITNGHAQLSARPDVPDTDFICFSDVPLARDDWEIRPVEASTDLSPRMRAKFHKLFPPTGYEWSVWVDGAYVLNTEEAANQFLGELIARSPSGLGLHRHCDRDCIFAEAEHSLTLSKCFDQRAVIEAQARHYEEIGHPRGWGLWAGGLMCRNSSTRVAEVMRSWWDEISRWSWRDQISLPVALRSARFRPDDWPWALWHNPLVPGWAWNPA